LTLATKATARNIGKESRRAEGKLTVNARVVGGMRVHCLDVQSQPIDGFGWIEIKGDSVEIPVSWSRSISSLENRAIRLEFELRDAQLFGFELR